LSRRRERPLDGLYIVGVTGGIASGKSTLVPRLAAALPSVVIDADRVGHAVLELPEVRRALAAEFGPDVLDGAGRVQRSVVGARAFASPGALAALDRITRPPLLSQVEQAMADAAAGGFVGLLVLDAALLVEWDKGGWCDRVISVVADPGLRARRLVHRTGMAQALAEQRIAAQLPDAARAAYADETIVNDGTLSDFEARADELAARTAGLARAALAARGHVL
jgi:dephospho-CoA kinase